MTKKVKEQIEFHYLLTEIQLYILSKITDKSITHSIFRKQDNESIMHRFYCIALM